MAIVTAFPIMFSQSNPETGFSTALLCKANRQKMFMNDDENRRLIEKHLDAYNVIDIDGMMSVIHYDIVFKNVAGGELNASASAADEFRKLAVQSKGLFSKRKQTITHFESKDDQAVIGIDY